MTEMKKLQILLYVPICHFLCEINSGEFLRSKFAICHKIAKVGNTTVFDKDKVQTKNIIS